MCKKRQREKLRGRGIEIMERKKRRSEKRQKVTLQIGGIKKGEELKGKENKEIYNGRENY